MIPQGLYKSTNPSRAKLVLVSLIRMSTGGETKAWVLADWRNYLWGTVAEHTTWMQSSRSPSDQESVCLEGLVGLAG